MKIFSIIIITLFTPANYERGHNIKLGSVCVCIVSSVMGRCLFELTRINCENYRGICKSGIGTHLSSHAKTETNFCCNHDLKNRNATSVKCRSCVFIAQNLFFCEFQYRFCKYFDKKPNLFSTLHISAAQHNCGHFNFQRFF